MCFEHVCQDYIYTSFYMSLNTTEISKIYVFLICIYILESSTDHAYLLTTNMNYLWTIEDDTQI